MNFHISFWRFVLWWSIHPHGVVHVVFSYITVLCIKLWLSIKNETENSEIDLRDKTFILLQVQQNKEWGRVHILFQVYCMKGLGLHSEKEGKKEKTETWEDRSKRFGAFWILKLLIQRQQGCLWHPILSLDLHLHRREESEISWGKYILKQTLPWHLAIPFSAASLTTTVFYKMIIQSWCHLPYVMYVGAKHQFYRKTSHFCSILYEDHNYITVFFTFLVSVLVSTEASVYTGDKHWNQVEDVCSVRVIPNQIKNFNNPWGTKSKLGNNSLWFFSKGTSHPFLSFCYH